MTAFSARIDDRYNRKKRTAPKNAWRHAKPARIALHGMTAFCSGSCTFGVPKGIVCFELRKLRHGSGYAQNSRSCTCRQQSALRTEMRAKHEPHGVLPHLGFTRSFARALTAFWSRKKQRHIKMRRMHCALCRDWRFQQTAHGSGTAKGTTILFLHGIRF